MTIRELECFRFRLYYKLELEQRLSWFKFCSDTPEIQSAEKVAKKDLLRIEELENEFTELISALPEAWRPVIEMRYIHNRPWPEVARETGYSRESVIRINRELTRWVRSGVKGNWR